MLVRSPWILASLRVLALAIILLHGLVHFLDESYAWGVWPATYLPMPMRWTLAGLAAFICWPPMTQRIATWLDRLSNRPPVPHLPWLLGLVSLIPFWLFRLAHTRWGDAYILSQAIAHPEVRLTYNWQAPLTVYLHAQLWALGHRLWGWADAMPAYALTSTLAGGVFVHVLARLSAELSTLPATGRDEPSGAKRSLPPLTFGLVITLGTIQLFFGYVENYTLMSLGMMVYLWLAWRCLQGRLMPVWPATALAITHALHPSTLLLAPSLVYLGWAWARRRAGTSGGLVAAWQIALPMIVVSGGVITLMESGGHGLAYLVGEDRPGGGDGRWLVPLFKTTTRWEHYTMFSWGHLLDIVNEQLLIAPVVLPALVCLALLAWPQMRHGTTWTHLLCLASGAYLLFIWTWNPDYGGQRDWDLFAPAAIPLTLLLADRLAAVLSDREALLQAGVMLIAAQALHTIAWVYQNTLPWSWPQ
ncbi:MAG: hypothetical protein RML36_04280 [Anaerolineae bacterium]|nr:hypothetical protein [Anaerolineae bacterium]MDW8098689.1 hypothetical protein [Anaerolineae bacterium]